jgi:hypothetical protein
MEVLRKIKKNFNHVMPDTDQDMNRGPVEYESRELPVEQCVQFFNCRVEVSVRNGGRAFPKKRFRRKL